MNDADTNPMDTQLGSGESVRHCFVPSMGTLVAISVLLVVMLVVILAIASVGDAVAMAINDNLVYHDVYTTEILCYTTIF